LTDRAIAVGDLVQVVRRPRCLCDAPSLGKIFTVVKLEECSNSYIGCNHEAFGENVAAISDSTPQLCIELCRLKRIPPLSELEGTKTDEPIEEMA
jgi:hypothetical protein